MIRTRTYYLLGRSGKPATFCCGAGDLESLARQLPPGDYWIQRSRGKDDRTDWGTLEVGDDGWYCLRRLTAVESGPGYVIV